MKVLTIVGARPQFIKAATVSRALAQQEGVVEIMLHTGQHFDHNMSKIFFEELAIKEPKYNLGISSLENSEMIGLMEDGITEVIKKEEPDIVIVYGDTNSTLAGARSAKNNKVKLAHVEAGLRSFNLNMAEERNRIATDELSDILFCPTKTAVDNLQEEGSTHLNKKIIRSGDVMYDSVLFYKDQIVARETSHVLATLHRAETTNDPDALSGYFQGLEAIHKIKEVIMPLHPRTAKALRLHGISPKISFIEPQSYLSMLQLIAESEVVITDSGGLQKEAFFMQKPCITMRNETEWVELTNAGANCLVQPIENDMVESYHLMKNKQIARVEQFYGNGDSAQIIVQILLQ